MYFHLVIIFGADNNHAFKIKYPAHLLIVMDA